MNKQTNRPNGLKQKNRVGGGGGGGGWGWYQKDQQKQKKNKQIGSNSWTWSLLTADSDFACKNIPGDNRNPLEIGFWPQT